jgi:hypothetical protein
VLIFDAESNEELDTILQRLPRPLIEVYESIHRRKNPSAHYPDKLIRGEVAAPE